MEEQVPEDKKEMPQLEVPVEVLKATRINRMVMHGFKSFAKHTEILFGGNFNCVLGPNGAGKCLDGDSLVSLSNGSTVKIRELVNEKLKINSQKLDDGFLAYDNSVKILALDTESLKVVPQNVQAFIKREAPEELLKIHTKSGREIISTLYHPLFVLKGGTVRAVKSEELKEGVRIAVPRQLNITPETKYFFELIDLIKPSDNVYVPWNKEFVSILNKIKKKVTWKNLAKKIGIPFNSIRGLLDKQSINFPYLVQILKYSQLKNMEIIELIPKIKSKQSSKSYKMLWKNSPSFARFLGYLIAEGRMSPTTDHIWFTNGDEEIVFDYVNIIKEIFNINPTINEYKPNCWDVIAYSSAIMTILSKFGMSKGKTEDKELSNMFLANSSNDELAEFLNGIYCGDGYVSNHSIEITTKSQKLALSVQNILTRLGISFISKDVIKIATNTGFSGKYKTIVIYGVNNFQIFNNHIKLVHKEKQKRIEKILGFKSNPNIDLIEANELVKQVTKDLKLKVKPLRKKFPRLDAYCYNQCTPSKNGLQILIKELFLPNGNSVSLQKLSSLVHSDIFWDEIIELEKIKPKEKWVYDLCVEKHHNFIANNIFVHNSNVLDALCFVLGKSSSRELRAEKSANLIYNGGKAKKPAKHGEVSIYFDNTNKVFPSDEKEVKITRIVRQTGQSVYKINDKTMTRHQITNLLSLAKIDPDGYNIILQGDITKFVEMHPEDRRILIEDIAGISIYEEKKHKAMLELEKVEQHLRETDLILTERNTYLKELRKDRDQALKYKNMSDNIKMNKASYLKIQIDKKNNEKNSIQEKIDAGNVNLNKLREKISKLKSENDEKKKRIESISKEIEEKGEIEQVKLNKEVETLKIDLTKHNSRIDTCRNELNKIKQRKTDLNSSIEDTGNRINQLTTQKNDFEGQIKNMEKDRDLINKKILKFKEKNKLDNVADIENKVMEIDKKAEDIQKEITSLREKQHNFIREKDRINHEINIIEDKLKKVIDVEKEHNQQVDVLKDKRQKFKAMTLDLNKALDEDSSLAVRLSESRRNLNILNEDIAKLRAKDITIKEFARGDLAVKKILEMKNKQQGIYGTVADLGNVSSKYAVALEVAAGPRLKSIVVENDKLAAELIKYLKDHKLGTATFLPLNKIKPREVSNEAKKLVEAKGVHDFAIKLVSFDPKFKKIFSYVFSGTIVVDSIHVATRLGIGKSKFVSLDGDVAEISGAMHGGFRGRKKEAYGFKEQEVAESLEENEKRLGELEGLVDVLEKNRAENESKITELREQKAILEGEIIKSETSMHLESSDTDVSRRQQKELEGQESKIDTEINNINNKISESNKNLTDLKIEKQKLRGVISQLNDPTLLAELNTFEQKFKELSEEIIRLSSEIKNLDAQIINIFLPEKEKTEKILKQIDKDQEGFNSELKELQQAIKQKEAILQEKETLAKEFYAKFKSLFTKQSKINEEIQKNDVSIDKLTEESRQVEIKVNFHSLKNAESTASLAALNQDFQQYEGVKLDLEKTEDQLKSAISKFEKMMQDIGSVNMRALEVYDEAEKQYKEFLDKKDKLGHEKEDVLAMMNEIEGKKKELFMKTFEVVNENFKKFFGMLTTKGAEANLVLENDENPFEAGVRVNVKITGSKFLDIRGLSGGEKTLTALAFIFAIQEHEPASFYVLDEVDAALDKHNSERLSKLIGEYSSKAQYIMISHNDHVISTADILYGVSMNNDGVSQIVSLKM
jgi:chromosome segregation protein|tara:strand:+ start:21148 stop:26337 length:5190 start_codon:yes stop_codon:yes gene_type:complete